MRASSLSVLLPRLAGWPQQLQPGLRYPQLEKFFARSRPGAALADALDPLRLILFGLDSQPEVPVAALCALASGGLSEDDTACCLRIDPVILQADMSRLLLMRTGFGGFPLEYRQQVKEVLQSVLKSENLTLHDADEGWWIVKLPQAPDVIFTSLDEALGDDVSECLPQGPEALFWRRLNNEIQMALHASEANRQRLHAGQAVINSVWFWGAGSLPRVTGRAGFDRVYADDPVTRGLAALQKLPLQSLEELPANAALLDADQPSSILVDWAVPAAAVNNSAALTPDSLEQFMGSNLGLLRKQGGRISLYSPERSWCLTRRELWRLWRTCPPMAQQLSALAPRP